MSLHMPNLSNSSVCVHFEHTVLTKPNTSYPPTTGANQRKKIPKAKITTQVPGDLAQKSELHGCG